ncbi:dTDP-4-amino-4,6-dideoxygalactose transaminase [Aliiglaciecola sp. 3_MG-2023]|uniref:dTDP-4-amino-4,6-dideoxygalactose transaminase n=1 Tax=Aliiglaciecola sp. 3_MG-2023 TaxID=3062644 RepID=UPI0026E34DFF|nr:dTDP-4-amino-4,6-dideoxygalactose transaminase [Aliiglaciecola sp. 3_MG-2023]MDO6691731.1 dTDP-4-amino-4,6-dideoxygalactose transaminase [Aliiglaciecola sp. 3_MG-2023]
MIPFNKPARTGHEDSFVIDAMNSSAMSGNNKYTQLCEKWFEEKLDCKRAMLVTSCTHALEMAAILLNIKDGDEVIVPSYTFVSSANAFVLRGAKIVFAEIDPLTLNMDVSLLESLITSKTKAIVPVHYAGVSCDMHKLMEIANKYNIKVVEDAAQCIGSKYKENPVGVHGHIATFSFHETKNITAGGEGGMLVINDPDLVDRAEILREKGTNRRQFSEGKVDKYTWVDIGSSYLLGELSAAYLYSQLVNLKQIHEGRMKSWNKYFEILSETEALGYIQLPSIPEACEHNGHIFHVRVKDVQCRKSLIDYFNTKGIVSVFHYVPLHSSPMGMKIGECRTSMKNTITESQRLLRLPLYFGLKNQEIEYISQNLSQYFQMSNSSVQTVIA